MSKASTPRRPVTAAQRGQIVQRVLVEGWSHAQAAAAFGVEERLVAAWVAAFRRDGMPSLHHNPSETLAGSVVESWLARPVSRLRRLLGAALARATGRTRPSAPSRLRDPGDHRRSG